MQIVSSSVEGSIAAFVPRLRPRPMSAGARMTAEQRPNARESFRGNLSSGLLTALNLSSLSDEDLDIGHCIPGMLPGLTADLEELPAGDVDGLYCDGAFGAHEESLVGMVARAGEVTEVDLRGLVQAWSRPEELAPAGRPAAVFDIPFKAPPASVVQGALGDCHLLGALSVLGTRPDLVQNLFGGPARTEPAWAQGESGVAADLRRGRATVRLYKDGAWRDVTVDTRLPCRAARSGAGLEPAFGTCADGGLFWVPLLEKAYVRAGPGEGLVSACVGGRRVATTSTRLLVVVGDALVVVGDALVVVGDALVVVGGASLGAFKDAQRDAHRYRKEGEKRAQE
jgi:hypothetical protein